MPDLRKRKFKATGRRPPPPTAPAGAQVAYLAELRTLLAYARALVNARLLPHLTTLVERTERLQVDTKGLQLDGRVDNLDADPHGRVNRLLDQISDAFFRKYPAKKLLSLTEKIARTVSAHQKTQLFRQVKATIGIDLSTIADKGLTARIGRFTAENVALIETLPQKYFDDVEKSVLTGMRKGARAKDIAEDMQERFNVASSRAKLIARDQVLKFNGELARTRQAALGIDHYIWRTVQDNRVRNEHSEREGETYSWGDPPGNPSDPAAGGHPGEAINCRCYAEPVMPA